MSHLSDREMINKTRNTARFFSENRHISWVLLIGTIVWGVFGYLTMPKRKDPEIPVRAAVAIASWPGATAENVEDRVTRVVEQQLAQNSKIEKLESTTRAGVAVVTITLDKSVPDTAQEFDDIWLKLESLKDLPDGAKLEFKKDFADVSALMLTVASPRASAVEIDLRARKIAAVIREARGTRPAGTDGVPATLVACFPHSLDGRELELVGKELSAWAEARGAREVKLLGGPGFFAIDTLTRAEDGKILEAARSFVAERLRASEIHPDVWPLAVIRDPAETARQAGARSPAKSTATVSSTTTPTSCRRRCRRCPRSLASHALGVLGDTIYLEYSQEKLSAYGVLPSQIQDILAARNIVARGGAVELEGKSVLIAPAGEFKSEAEIGSVIVTRSSNGAPVYLRDLVQSAAATRTPSTSPSLRFATRTVTGSGRVRSRSR